MQGYELDMQTLPDDPKSDVDFSEILNAIQESKFDSHFKFTVREEIIIILGSIIKREILDPSFNTRTICCLKSYTLQVSARNDG